MTETHFAASIPAVPFKRALTAVTRATPKRCPLPIAQYVHMRSTAEHVHMTATDLQTTLTLTVPAQVSVQGETVLDPAALKSLTGTKAPVEIAVNGTADAASGALLVSVPMLDACDYPVIPQFDGEPIAAIDAADLLSALSYVVPSAAKDDTRPILTGVRVVFRGTQTQFAATDGFRMHFQSVPATVDHECALIVPAATLDLLIKCKPTGPVMFATRPQTNLAFIAWDGGVIACRLIEGTYPNLDMLVPSKFTTTAMLDTAELRSFATLAAKARAIAITFTMQPGTDATVEYRIDARPTTGTIRATVDGAPLTVELKPQYILDALTADAYTLLQCTGPNSAALLSPVDAGTGQAVVMPMHTNRPNR